MYAMILGISSFLLVMTASWGCYFAAADFVFVGNSQKQYQNAGGMGIGFFSFEDKAASSDLPCKLYSTEQVETFDTIFQIARYLSIASNILIGAGMIILVCLACIAVRRRVIKLISAILILGALCHGSTFIIYASDEVCESCEFMFGSGLSIICTMTTIINAIVTYRMPEADIVSFDDGDNGKTHSASGEEELPPTSDSGELPNDDSSSVWTAPGSPRKRKVINIVVEEKGLSFLEQNPIEQEYSRG